jgi:hypothetical protein
VDVPVAGPVRFTTSVTLEVARRFSATEYRAAPNWTWVSLSRIVSVAVDWAPISVPAGLGLFNDRATVSLPSFRRSGRMSMVKVLIVWFAAKVTGTVASDV